MTSDRYIRTADALWKTVQYIENNPVKAATTATTARLSVQQRAWFRAHEGSSSRSSWEQSSRLTGSANSSNELSEDFKLSLAEVAGEDARVPVKSLKEVI